MSVSEAFLELKIFSGQSNLENGVADEQGVHITYQNCKEIPIDPQVLAEDAEYRRKIYGAAFMESAGPFPVAPNAAQEQETTPKTKAPLASDAYLASTLHSAPVPAIALSSSTSSFLSPSNPRGNRSDQTSKDIHSGSSPGTTLV